MGNSQFWLEFDATQVTKRFRVDMVCTLAYTHVMNAPFGDTPHADSDTLVPYCFGLSD